MWNSVFGEVFKISFNHSPEPVWPKAESASLHLLLPGLLVGWYHKTTIVSQFLEPGCWLTVLG